MVFCFQKNYVKQKSFTFMSILKMIRFKKIKDCVVRFRSKHQYRKIYYFLFIMCLLLTNTSPTLGQVNCNLGSNIPSDEKQTIQSATATSVQQGEGIERTYDNNTSTIFHSSWGGGGFPITLEYTLSNAGKVDYIIYTPRLDGSDNGKFQEIEIQYSTAANPGVFLPVSSINLNAPSSAVRINLPFALITPSKIRIIVNSGKNNFATCAEIGFYKIVNSPPLNIFKDNVCTWIKSGITQADINSMSDGFYKNLAQCMFNGTYDTTYRVQRFEPYAHFTTLANQLKTSTYSQFENPSGIYLEPGTAIIFVENDFGQNLSLRVFDYSGGSSNINDNTYPICTGVNKIDVSKSGLVYINYYSDDYKKLQPVRIHITSGKINGYFDVSKHDNTTWNSLLRNTTTSMIDLKGKKIGMLYPKQSLLQFSPNNGKELVQFYDSIVTVQHMQMGLSKYKKVPKNHMFAYAYDESGWYAGGWGAHFGGGLDVTCSKQNILNNNIWGIAHELGHVNQIRPGLKWVGTTEVTNNIHSIWATYTMTFPPLNRKLETEKINDCLLTASETGLTHGSGNEIEGGRFNAYLNNALLKKQQWLCQYGSDSYRSDGNEPDWQHGGDVFVALTPLWQLMLYYQIVHPDKKDWYGDIAEIVRKTNETGLEDGVLITNFLKNTCDVVKEDLTEFFQKVGMLRTYNKVLNDYWQAQVTITPADSAAVVSYIQSKHYPKPESPVIYYLSANSINSFTNHSNIEGVANSGCSAPSGSGIARMITVDHSVWRNVAVFETYNGSNLTRLSMVGAGFINNNSTKVYYPEGSTAVYAVGWDGQKQLVFGNTSNIPLVNRITNILGTSFMLEVKTLPQGGNYDVSLDGGNTFTITNKTSESITISDLALNTSYKVVTRLNYNGTVTLSGITNVTTGSQSIKDGNYKIVTKLNTRVVSVENNSAVAGSQIVMYDPNNVSSQIFTVAHLGNNVYKFIPKNAIGNAIGINGSNIQTLANTNQDAIKWKIVEDGNGFFSIRSYSDNSQCWDVYQGYANNNTPIVLWSWGNGADNRRWAFNRELTCDTLIYSIPNKTSTSITISVSNLGYGSTWDVSVNNGESWIQTNITTSTITVNGLTSGTQYPLIIRHNSLGGLQALNTLRFVSTLSETPQLISNGTYKISSKLDSRVVNVQNGSTSAGAPIVTFDSNNEISQVFTVTHFGNDVYTISPQCAPSTAVGINNSYLQTMINTNQDAVKWKIIDDGNGYCSIRSYSDNGQCWDIYQGYANNNTPIILWSWSGGQDNRRWKFNPVMTPFIMANAMKNRTFSIYPNPTASSFIVSRNDENLLSSNSVGTLQKAVNSSVSISIFNEQGQLLRQQNTFLNQPISVSSLREGLYIIHINDGKVIHKEKFIIRRN